MQNNNDTKLNIFYEDEGGYVDVSKSSFMNYFISMHKQEWIKNCQRVRAVAQCLLMEESVSVKISKKEQTELHKKIQNEIQRSGGFIADTTQCLKDILTCSTAAVHFAKDPLKQNLAEKCQLQYLQTIKGKVNLYKLPALGKKAVYLADGELKTNCTKAPSGTDSTKSLDFADANGDRTYYYYAKFTQIEGGAQNNQEKDAVCFVEQANHYANKHSHTEQVFILLVDGRYYTETRKADIRKKIDANNYHRVRVCSCDEIE